MQTKLDMVMDDRLSPEQDVSRVIYELVQDFMDGTLVLPEYQRDFKWAKSKRRAYVKRLESDRRPIGVFATYELRNGRNGLTFLTDGGNRIRTLAELLREPESYGFSREDAKNLLKKRLITVQHRHYDSHMEGYVDFQLINLGTVLTPYEFNKGILATMPDYPMLWKPVLDRLIRAIDAEMARVVTDVTNNPGKLDTLRRDSMATFYRFISGFDTAVEFRINAPAKAQDVWERKSFEWGLREQFECLGVEKIDQEIRRFARLVAEETSLIEKVIYQELKWSIGRGISLGLYRWLLAVAVWRRNVGVPVKKWESFVTGLIGAGQGGASIYWEGKPRVVLSYQRLNELGRAGEVAGVDLTIHKSIKRGRRNSLKNGWHHSHLEPKSVNGDGPTIPEPGGLNMARGSKPMSDEEMSALT